MDTLINRKYAFDAMKSVDWTLILMFMGLFVWLAGFQNTLFPDVAFDFLHTYIHGLEHSTRRASLHSVCVRWFQRLKQCAAGHPRSAPNSSVGTAHAQAS